MEPEEEILKLSKYNSAALINLRITNLWEDANRHSRECKFSSWNADLDRIWCELSGDATIEHKKDMKKYNKLISLASPIRNLISGVGFAQETKQEIKKRNIQYKLLINKELFLRKLMNQQGKGTAYEDDDGFE